MESARVRLVFQDHRMLSKAQKSEGLKRSWILLTPQLQTISDLSSYLLHSFRLQQSCPNGIILFMDGFVLPPFESTCILKDKDIICVKRKGGTLSDTKKIGDVIDSVEEIDIVEKQPLPSGLPLLANEEFGKESGGLQSEIEGDEEDHDGHRENSLHEENSCGENAVSKKRKASKKLRGSKKKKQQKLCPDSTENEVDKEPAEIYNDDEVLPRKRSRKKVTDAKSKEDMGCIPESAVRNGINVRTLPCKSRTDRDEQNNEVIQNLCQIPEGTKRASRSAGRKKSTGQWMCKIAKIGKQDSSKEPLEWKQEPVKAAKKDDVPHLKELLQRELSPGKDAIKSVVDEQPNQRSATDDNVIPVVIRPGHIRFEPPCEDHADIEDQMSVGTFLGDGIISKKCQKWDNENFSTSQIKSRNFGEECAPISAIENKTPLNDASSFDKLPTLLSLPKEGIVIAYRLLELSSSWTPELSSYRVGKVSCYDPGSSKIKLIPVPEYPLSLEKSDEDASQSQITNTLYGGDGSLEIDFPSLVDVRLVKQGKLDPPEMVATVSPAGNRNAVPNTVPRNNSKDKGDYAPANGAVNPCEQLTETLNAKKTQLSQEDCCRSKGSSGKSSWSYRALRGSALGPTMALLRSNNEI